MPHIHELYDFTASAFVIHPSEPKLLLLKHRKIGKWLQPGGHIELDEDPIMAMQREMQEETGLKPTDYTILESADQPQVNQIEIRERTLPLPFHLNLHDFDASGKHQHIDLEYLVKAKTDKLTDNPEGADDIGWFSLEDIKKFNRDNDLLMPLSQFANGFLKNISPKKGSVALLCTIAAYLLPMAPGG